jgi:hypothetical protein
MTENTIDLKRLIHTIKDAKNFNANLILDEGCVFETSDPKPLVKVINYIINYLNQLAKQPLEISLDLRTTDYLLSLLVYTDQQDLPAISDQLADALKTYRATLDKIHEKGKYIQFKISFAR